MSLRTIMAFLTSLAVVVAPFALQAAGLPGRIVTCDGTSVGGGTDCTICDLAKLAQNIINTGIFVAVFLSAILFAYAGWLYISNEALDEVGRAKKIFLDVVLGLSILLGAWLVVDTLIRTILGGSGFGPWNSLC